MVCVLLPCVSLNTYTPWGRLEQTDSLAVAVDRCRIHQLTSEVVDGYTSLTLVAANVECGGASLAVGYDAVHRLSGLDIIDACCAEQLLQTLDGIDTAIAPCVVGEGLSCWHIIVILDSCVADDFEHLLGVRLGLACSQRATTPAT